MKSATIIGGGLAGLYMARRMSALGWHVKVLEEHDISGGLCRDATLGGHRVERYYHHVFKAEKEIQSLIRELGLSGDFRWFRVHKGKNQNVTAHRAPGRDGFGRAIGRFFDDAGFALDILTTRDITRLDEMTAVEWLARHFRPDVLDELWVPLLKKKFGIHWRQISAWWLADRISARISSTNLVTGSETLGYLKGGFARVTDALADQAVSSGVEVLRGTKVFGLDVADGRVAGLRTDRGDVDCDGPVISTIPRPSVARLLGFPEDAAAGWPPYMSCACPIILTDRSLSDRYWTTDSGDNPFCAIIEQSKLYPGPLNVVYLPDYVIGSQKPTHDEGLHLIDRAVSALSGVFSGFDQSAVVASTLSYDAFCQPVFMKGCLKSRAAWSPVLQNFWITDPLDDFPNQTRGMAATVRRAHACVERIGRP